MNRLAYKLYEGPVTFYGDRAILCANFVFFIRRAYVHIYVVYLDFFFLFFFIIIIFF